MKTKPGGRAARTDLPPEIPEELKALDDAALLDALETQPPAVATRALHERLRKKPAPSDAFKSGARVLLARIVFRTPSSSAATAAAAYGFSGPDGALLLEALRGALEKASSTNAFTNAAARALVATDADAYKREEWPLSAKVALVHAAAKTLRNADAASKLCADASRNADDDVTRAAALDALTALAKRSQSCRGVASQVAADSLRRPLDRRRFASAVACLKSCGASNVTAALKTATDADACLRGRCAALEAALPSLQAPPSTMWIDLVEPGLTGDAGSRRAAVDLASAATSTFGFESSGALQCLVQSLASSKQGVDELCLKLLDCEDHDRRCSSLAAELLLGAPPSCRVRACRAALQARSQSTHALKLLDDDALSEAVTDADDACRAAAVEVLGRRSSDVRRLAAFFDDAPLEKALKCAARRLARSSSALELGELACRALSDASTEANATSVLEGLSDGPHAVELTKRCRSQLLDALRTSRWDRRRRVYYDLLRLGPPINENAKEDFSDGSARLTALSGDGTSLASKAEGTIKSPFLGALALLADQLDDVSALSAAGAAARDLKLWGAQLPAEDGHEDSSDDEDESDAWHGCRNACSLAQRVARHAPTLIGDAALELLLRTRHTGAINGGESVLRAASLSGTDEDRRRWLKTALTSCRRPDDHLARRRSAGLGAAHAALLDTDPSLAPNACKFLITIASNGGARDAKRSLNVLAAVADRAANALRHDLGKALSAALKRADDADWGCRGAAALCAAALLRRLYRDERSLFDGAEGDLHSYTDIKEAVDDALAREGPIGRTIALRCIRGCRASKPSRETWLSLLSASDQRVRVAAAET